VTRLWRLRQDAATILRPTGASSKFVTYFELLDAFGKPGWPVCTNLERGSLKALSDMLDEQVTDPASHRRLVGSGGYCNWHAWMLPKVQNSPLGAALIYRHLLMEALERLKTSRHNTQGRCFWRRLWKRLIGKHEGPPILLDWWRALDVFVGRPGVFGSALGDGAADGNSDLPPEPVEIKDSP